MGRHRLGDRYLADNHGRARRHQAVLRLLRLEQLKQKCRRGIVVDHTVKVLHGLAGSNGKILAIHMSQHHTVFQFHLFCPFISQVGLTSVLYMGSRPCRIVQASQFEPSGNSGEFVIYPLAKQNFVMHKRYMLL